MSVSAGTRHEFDDVAVVRGLVRLRLSEISEIAGTHEALSHLAAELADCEFPIGLERLRRPSERIVIKTMSGSSVARNNSRKSGRKSEASS